MAALTAGIILYVVSAYATSAVAVLSVAAVAEALPPARAAKEVHAWLCALATPYVVAGWALFHAARSHRLDPSEWSDHQERVRHISFWWIADSPDAAYRVKFVAAIGALLLALAIIRPVFSAVLAWRYGRSLERSSMHVPELDVWITPLSRPWSTCVGLFSSRVYVTSGAAKLLNSQELSSVLAHEHAHGRRRDNLLQLIGQALLGPMVLMPTGRYAFRRMQAAIERAADQEAASTAEQQHDLAAALVKAGRKLRDFSPDPDEETLKRHMADRYREEFVGERAQQLLDASEALDAKDPRRASPLMPVVGLVIVSLLIAATGFLGPTVRSLYESLLAALAA